MRNTKIRRLFTRWFGTSRKSVAVGILGSGRCGTSMAARAISFLGVDLGNQFIKKNKTNPKGFWEHKGIVNTHKKIKATLGRRPFPEGWQKRKEILPYKEQLKDLITQDFSGKSFWGWKDPRTSESIALWRDIFEELGIEPRFLIMIRNPVDVAASYRKAYDREEDAALRQWQMRTLLSLKGSEGTKRVIADYDDFLENSLETLRKIANALELPWPKDEARLQRALDDFIDPNLQHNRTGLDELDRQTDIEEDTKQLYKICLEAARRPEMLEHDDFQQEIDRLYEAFMRVHSP